MTARFSYVPEAHRQAAMYCASVRMVPEMIITVSILAAILHALGIILIIV